MKKLCGENEKCVSVIFVDAIFIHGQLLQSYFVLNSWHGQLHISQNTFNIEASVQCIYIHIDLRETCPGIPQSSGIRNRNEFFMAAICMTNRKQIFLANNAPQLRLCGNTLPPHAVLVLLLPSSRPKSENYRSRMPATIYSSRLNMENRKFCSPQAFKV
jgi:hypothetical protein